MKDSFLNALSAPQPIPGGGAAAAYGASVGLALLEKIVRLEFGRDHLAQEMNSLWSDLLNQTEQLKDSLARLREKDGETYIRWVESRGSEKERDTALREAIECPVGIMKASYEALACTAGAGERCKKHLLADLMVVCELLEASIKGAYYIARSNLRLADHAPWGIDLRKELDRLRDQCHESFLRVEEAILARAKIE